MTINEKGSETHFRGCTIHAAAGQIDVGIPEVIVNQVFVYLQASTANGCSLNVKLLGKFAVELEQRAQHAFLRMKRMAARSID